MRDLYRGFALVAAFYLGYTCVAVELERLLVRRPGVTEVEHYR